jgi:hypothetical protein
MTKERDQLNMDNILEGFFLLENKNGELKYQKNMFLSSYWK